MRFEYNGNLLEEDRINLVANEIIEKYPQISVDKAREIAMLEGRISDNKTFFDEFNRLYNIMLVNCDNKDIVYIVYRDFLRLLTNNMLFDDINYNYLIDGINNYFKNNAEFPYLSDMLF